MERISNKRATNSFGNSGEHNYESCQPCRRYTSILSYPMRHCFNCARYSLCLALHCIQMTSTLLFSHLTYARTHRDADPEFGFIQSKELEVHLKEIMAVYDVEVLRGGGVSDGYIEARPKGVSKGLFVNHAIATMKANSNEPDFILVVGDDSSDEPMFEYLNSIAGSGSSTSGAGGVASPSAEDVSYFTVTVGKKPSAASTFVDDPGAVMDVLSTLIKSAQRDRKHSSAVDLLAAVSQSSQVTYLDTPYPSISSHRRHNWSHHTLPLPLFSCFHCFCLLGLQHQGFIGQPHPIRR